jgi:hypothetical protein
MNPLKKVDFDTGEIIIQNPNFFQFYKANFSYIRFLVAKNPIAARLFFFLIENMDTMNALVVSQKAISEALKMGRTSIWKATDYLKKHKYVETFKSGNTYIYCVNCQLVWQQTHEKKRFAKFNAKVYISESEQVKLGKTCKIAHFESKHEIKTLFDTNTLFDHEL